MGAARWVLGVVMLLLFVGVEACSKDETSSGIEHGRMVQIYTDLAVLNELHPGQSPAFLAARDSLLRVHGIDTARFRTALAWYAAHPAEQRRLLSDALDRLEPRAPSAP